MRAFCFGPELEARTKHPNLVGSVSCELRKFEQASLEVFARPCLELFAQRGRAVDFRSREEFTQHGCAAGPECSFGSVRVLCANLLLETREGVRGRAEHREVEIEHEARVRVFAAMRPSRQHVGFDVAPRGIGHAELGEARAGEPSALRFVVVRARSSLMFTFMARSPRVRAAFAAWRPRALALPARNPAEHRTEPGTIGALVFGRRSPRARTLIDTEISSIEQRSRGRLSSAEAGSVLAFIIGALVLGAFAPRKTAGFAAPGLRKLIASFGSAD